MPQKRRAGIEILDGAATLTRPTDAKPYWRIVWTDPITRKRRTTSGGKTREEAEAKAASLLGIYVEGQPDRSRTDPVPTFNEMVTSWINTRRPKWSPRTPEHYTQLARAYTNTLGDIPINRIRPSQLTDAYDLTAVSRDRQKTTKTVIKGVFSYAHSLGWVKSTGDHYADALILTGDRTDNRQTEVSKGDIPPSDYVAAVLNVTWHTLDPHLTLDHLTYSDDNTPAGPLKIDAEELWREPTGFHSGYSPIFRAGLPPSIIDKKRRGVPKHYKNLDQIREREDCKLRERYKMLSAIVALGAGAGLRIGEIFALRVGHFLDESALREWLAMRRVFGTGYRLPWDGKIHVSESASTANAGKIWVTAPKSNRDRYAYLPPFLRNDRGQTPRWDFAHRKDTETPTASDWRSLSEEDALTIWHEQNAPALYMIVMHRLEAVVTPWLERDDLTERERIRLMARTMLFPTRQPPKRNKQGEISRVKYSPRWTGYMGPDPLTGGTYMSHNNFKSEMNEIYDFVSDRTGSYPAHRRNRETRQGWTHHALRHYAVSTRLDAGIPVAQVALEMGHASPAFTMARYAHAVRSSADADWSF
ncbi:hypothetical protein LG274_12095 [Micrococcus antarcticus]|uniref:hypothetical protein n=1 Tax=Micrococcus antarcticus TaxID=86171 RepID=UPI00384D5E1F